MCLTASESSTSGQAIVSAVTSGSRQYFLGTDSAPHDKRMKECSCGCAGIYSAPVALSLYAKVFEQVIYFFSITISSSLVQVFCSVIVTILLETTVRMILAT